MGTSKQPQSTKGKNMQTTTASKPANGTAQKGPGAPRKSDEEKRAAQEARKAKLAAMSPREALEHRFIAAVKHWDAVARPLKRAGSNAVRAALDSIENALVQIQDGLNELPADFALPAAPRGRSGMGRGDTVTVKEAWARVLGLDTGVLRIADVDDTGEIMFLPAKDGTVKAVPRAGVLRYPPVQVGRKASAAGASA